MNDENIERPEETLEEDSERNAVCSKGECGEDPGGEIEGNGDCCMHESHEDEGWRKAETSGEGTEGEHECREKVEAGGRADGVKEAEDTERLERLLQEAEERGYLRGRNEKIEEFMRHRGREVPASQGESGEEDELPILKKLKRSVW